VRTSTRCRSESEKLGARWERLSSHSTLGFESGWSRVSNGMAEQGRKTSEVSRGSRDSRDSKDKGNRDRKARKAAQGTAVKAQAAR
jgi:hypothetical protein